MDDHLRRVGTLVRAQAMREADVRVLGRCRFFMARHGLRLSEHLRGRPVRHIAAGGRNRGLREKKRDQHDLRGGAGAGTRQHAAILVLKRSHLAGSIWVTIVLPPDPISAWNLTLSPAFTRSSIARSLTSKTIVIGGMSIDGIGPCLMVTVPAFLSNFLISPSASCCANAGNDAASSKATMPRFI